MFGLLFLLFTVVPAVELYLLIQIGKVIGGGPTVAFVIAMGVLGAWLAKREGLQIVRTVIDLAHNLGKQVCAEGVEDEGTWRKLKELGCDLAQGFYSAAPSTREALLEWLRSGWPAASQVA